jgi:NAD(P)-dependent dehydrogenase (short-subunit alcohol dehydrogenase family)
MSQTGPTPRADGRVLGGKLALVTGAYGDIGTQIVIGLARAGATVIAAGRDAGKLGTLAQAVSREVPGAKVEPLVLDLADLASVQRAADAVLESGRPLDVLVNNAAVMPGRERQTTSDGFELAFGTNQLGPFALVGHLLPALLAAPEARVITVTAGTSRSPLDTIDLNSERRYRGGMRTYTATKYAAAVYAQELARRLAGTSIKSLTILPGVAATGVQRHNPLIGFLAKYLFAPVTSTPAQAARPAIYTATHPGLANGALIGPGGLLGIKGEPRLHKRPAGLTDQASAAQLWETSQRLTGVHYSIPK